jgi:hypothetical protein
VMASLVEHLPSPANPHLAGREPRGQQRITPCTPCEISQDK